MASPRFAGRLHFSIKLRSRRLIETGSLLKAQDADSFEKAERASASAFAVYSGVSKLNLDMALRGRWKFLG